MNSSSQGRYQGYPYANPHVTEVPTLDPATAGRWANLPRRQIYARSTQNNNGPRTPTNFLEVRDEPSSSRARMAMPIRPAPDVNPVVYIDLPDEGTCDVTEFRENSRPQNNQVSQPSANPTRQPLPSKPEPDENPVVYIDLPEESGSEVSQREERRNEPQFVQETIFYDPFENRRIDEAKGTGTVGSSSSHNSESDVDSVESPRRVAPLPPQRPRLMDLTDPGGAGISATSPISSSASTLSRLPENYIRPLPELNLPTSLPGSGFPEPPPAYTEFEISTPPVVEQPRAEPPRTQVLLPGPGNANSDRQYLKCQHCGMQVHTLVVRDIGFLTHIFALLCLVICMLPCVVLIYYVDCMKNKNHFCPNCNKVVGYELPLNRKKVLYYDD